MVVVSGPFAERPYALRNHSSRLADGRYEFQRDIGWQLRPGILHGSRRARNESLRLGPSKRNFDPIADLSMRQPVRWNSISKEGVERARYGNGNDVLRFQAFTSRLE